MKRRNLTKISSPRLGTFQSRLSLSQGDPQKMGFFQGRPFLISLFLFKPHKLRSKCSIFVYSFDNEQKKKNGHKDKISSRRPMSPFLFPPFPFLFLCLAPVLFPPLHPQTIPKSKKKKNENKISKQNKKEKEKRDLQKTDLLLCLKKFLFTLRQIFQNSFHGLFWVFWVNQFGVFITLKKKLERKKMKEKSEERMKREMEKENEKKKK